MIDLFQLTAQRRHGVPAGWRWRKLDSFNKPKGFIEMQGAVPIGEYKSGPRKGRPKWPKESECQTIWLKDSEMDEVAAEWESETGKCHKCDGSGQEFWAWSAKDGTKTRTCKRCEGSGKPSISKESI